MIVSINQPAYLPWLGYFHRIAVSDVHIVLDHVQFEKNSFVNRNRLRTSQGWCWMTVPVRTAGRFGRLAIADLVIDNARDWRRKHWDTIRQYYSRSRYFAEHGSFLFALYERSWLKLADLCEHVTSYLLDAFAIKTRVLRSSNFQVQGKGSDLVLNLCRAVGARTYLSGPLGRRYLVEGDFRQANIRVTYHEYRHPVYEQVFQPFEPYMAALDLLLNQGPISREILMRGQVPVAV
jgi:hypothetical protein